MKKIYSIISWLWRILIFPFVWFVILDLCEEVGSYEILKDWFNPLYSIKKSRD